MIVKKILDVVGDLRITFWLLVATVALCVTGGLVASKNYVLINSLNSMRIQDWLLTQGVSNFGKSWWVFALLFVLLLLGVNTVACACSRILALLPKRKSMGWRAFSVTITPSLIHILFLVALAGHLVSSAFSTQVKFPLARGSEYELPGGTRVTVADIRTDYYPETSYMKNRIKEVTAILDIQESEGSSQASVSYGIPLSIRGWNLRLDMKKKRGNYQETAAADEVARSEKLLKKTEETCNKAHMYHVQPKVDRAPEEFLLAQYDPGFRYVMGAIVLIIIMMIWYFPQAQRNHA